MTTTTSTATAPATGTRPGTARTAVVTGASRGIGLAVTRALAADGLDVVAGARTVTAELDAAAAATLAVDLATPDGPGRLVDLAVERFGGVDVLVNNVGWFAARTGGFAALTDADWQQMLDVNFLSAVRAIRAALPTLVERGGIVVNVSSVGARLPQPPIVDYSAAKAALTNLGTALAEELGPQGVQVTTVSPGPTRSSAWEASEGFGADLAAASGVSQEEFLAGFAEQNGLSSGRMTEPDEVAAVIALLASGRVRNTHGADIALDGGQAKQI